MSRFPHDPASVLIPRPPTPSLVYTTIHLCYANNAPLAQRQEHSISLTCLNGHERPALKSSTKTSTKTLEFLAKPEVHLGSCYAAREAQSSKVWTGAGSTRTKRSRGRLCRYTGMPTDTRLGMQRTTFRFASGVCLGAAIGFWISLRAARPPSINVVFARPQQVLEQSFGEVPAPLDYPERDWWNLLT